MNDPTKPRDPSVYYSRALLAAPSPTLVGAASLVTLYASPDAWAPILPHPNRRQRRAADALARRQRRPVALR